ncbi:MAG: DUF3501 family protein [Acidobacteria bacterium]|nr:DUF3501 family protein [Acidobacteriota bacterium]
MRLVQRSEIVDYQTYEETRPLFRAEVLKAKAVRRIHIGENLTLLFENHLTVRYQIQEMMRAERIVKESNIVHEINTYNELLGQNKELGATLLIEIDDPRIRQVKLKEWWQLPEKIYLLLEDQTRIFAKFDERQREEGKLSSVQFLKFATEGKTPIAAGVDIEGYKVEALLTNEQCQALKEDLK